MALKMKLWQPGLGAYYKIQMAYHKIQTWQGSVKRYSISVKITNIPGLGCT